MRAAAVLGCALICLLAAVPGVACRTDGPQRVFTPVAAAPTPTTPGADPTAPPVITTTVAAVATAGPGAVPTSAPATPTATVPPAKPVPVPFRPGPVQAIPAPPDRDPLEIARRLRAGGAEPVQPTPDASARPVREGDRGELWVLQDEGGGRRVGTVVRRTSEHAVWLFDETVSVRDLDLDRAVQAFEGGIWPAVTGLFGGLGGPGLNGDPRITIFHTSLDEGLAGYYSSSDEFPADVHPFSNGRKMIYIDTRKLALGSSPYLIVLAHELQHAVHFAIDPGEDAWINEGLSELAVVKAGYVAQSPPAFLANPNVQLNVWPDGSNTGPNYGAALLFAEYLIEHYGGDAGIRRLVAQQADGLEGVDAYLAELGYRERALDVFRDWTVANYVDEDGTRFGYAGRTLAPVTTRTVSSPGTVSGRVAQMGAVYHALTPGTTGFALRFDGEPSAALIPVQPKSLRGCWWGNRGDSIDSKITRTIDLTGVATAVLRYAVWFAIEDEWDYSYVTASGDGGATWTILDGIYTTRRNTNGTAFGPGYTGLSGDWLAEQIDLAPFAGRQMLLRLEYVTDDAVHRQGICFDDFEVREVGWSDPAESDGDWDADGFTRVSGEVAQKWLVQAIRSGPGMPVRVISLPVGESGEAEFRVEDIGPGESVVIVVSAVSPESMTPGHYTLELSPIASGRNE